MHTCDSVHQACDLTYGTEHAKAHSRLWKLAAWSFLCRGLTVLSAMWSLIYQRHSFHASEWWGNGVIDGHVIQAWTTGLSLLGLWILKDGAVETCPGVYWSQQWGPDSLCLIPGLSWIHLFLSLILHQYFQFCELLYLLPINSLPFSN